MIVKVDLDKPSSQSYTKQTFFGSYLPDTKNVNSYFVAFSLKYCSRIITNISTLNYL